MCSSLIPGKLILEFSESGNLGKGENNPADPEINLNSLSTKTNVRFCLHRLSSNDKIM